MKKKTYGVSGYIEWIAGINIGSATLQVPFTGGAITKYGVVPAEYTTSDPVIQHLIENSGQYGKDKRIVLLRVEDIPDTKKAAISPGRMETIQVSALIDAAQILHDRFGIPTARITSKEEAKRIGADHKIIFEGI